MRDREPLLAVVIIGRNEGERLKRCLSSVQAMRRPREGMEIIYVDSASTDDSPLIAEQAKVQVIRLHPEWPTAALARNAGWRATAAPFVFFLDGDCLVEQDFAVCALRQFDNSRVAVVWGRLREANPRGSFYNRILDIQWICLRNLPPGPAFYGAGVGLVRRSALEAVNGFHEPLIAGENTDMGRRMQARGYVILHMELPMARHDAAITRFSQYWRRYFREGYSYARLMETFRGTDYPLFRFEFAIGRGAFLLVAPIAALAGYTLLDSSLAPASVIAIVVGMIADVAWKAHKKTSNLRDALLFTLGWHFKLIPNLLGHITYQFDKRLGRHRSLIEYK